MSVLGACEHRHTAKNDFVVSSRISHQRQGEPGGIAVERVLGGCELAQRVLVFPWLPRVVSEHLSLLTCRESLCAAMPGGSFCQPGGG